jgi:uncharacterized protein (TIGR02266 family)
VPGKDKRRHSRVKPRGVVAHVRSGDRSFACQVENLSAGGLFLRTDQLFPRGTRVDVDLVRPGARRALRVAGRVVGTITPEEAVAQRFIPGLGVEFSELADDEAERLEALLGALGVRPDEAKVLRSQPMRTQTPISSPPLIQRIYTPPPDLAPVPHPSRTPSRPPPLPLQQKPAGARVEAEAILRHIAEALDVDDSAVEDRSTPGHSSTLPRIAAAPVPTPTPVPAIARTPSAPVTAARPASPGEIHMYQPHEAAPEAARLMLQIRGLIFELGEAQARLRSREAEIQDLRSQLDDMRKQLEDLESRRGA